MSTNQTIGIAPAIQNLADRFSAGDWLYWKCEYEKARDQFQDILKEPSVSASDSARCYKSMGAVEVQLKHYDEALNNYNKQLDILMKYDSPTRNEDIMTCYVSIGKVYWLKSDYDQAIEYHQRVLDTRSFTPTPSRISTVYKNLGNIYTSAKKFDLALGNFQKALEIDHQHLRKDHPQFGQTYANMGKMYESQQNYKEALVYFKKARETWLKTLASTHVYIEKIEKTICKMKSQLGKGPNYQEINFYPISCGDL
jgi:tetratricopeptide (TPR) repeat protein